MKLKRMKMIYICAWYLKKKNTQASINEKKFLWSIYTEKSVYPQEKRYNFDNTYIEQKTIYASIIINQLRQ